MLFAFAGEAVTELQHTCKKRLSAVSTMVIESSSGVMKARALAMAMKTSSLTRDGTFCCFIHWVTVRWSCWRRADTICMGQVTL